MSLLIFFNQGGSASPFVPASIPPVRISNVYAPKTAFKDIYSCWLPPLRRLVGGLAVLLLLLCRGGR